MTAQLSDWHAGFTAVIDVDRATVHARGELGIFTLELLRGAIACPALQHPPSIIVSLAEVSSIDRYSARILGVWQQDGVPSVATHIHFVWPARLAGTDQLRSGITEHEC